MANMTIYHISQLMVFMQATHLSNAINSPLRFFKIFDIMRLVVEEEVAEVALVRACVCVCVWCLCVCVFVSVAMLGLMRAGAAVFHPTREPRPG